MSQPNPSPAPADRVAYFLKRFCTHTKGPAAGQSFLLEQWQREFVREFYRVDARRRRIYRLGILGLPRGNGKALALATPIPTPAGWTTMGELQVGDLVFGADGQPTRVLAATPPLIGRECFAIGFSVGEPIVADADHLWLTEEPNRRNAALLRRTHEIAATLLQSIPRHGQMWQSSRHRVRLTQPLALPSADLPIDPYVLGVWLGDGDSDAGRITPGDHWIADAVRKRGYEVEARRNGSKATRFLVRGLQPELRKLGLLQNKHIPISYLRASVKQRLDLLRGLMDTDGYATAQGGCELTSVLPRLADDALELIRTLGNRVEVGEGRATLQGRDIGPKWRITFSPEIAPFTLPRKLQRWRPATARVRYSRITSCEPTETVPVRCITVERSDGMFLAGRVMIPTHNSPLAAGFGLWELTSRQDSPDVFIAAGAKEQARITIDYARAFVEGGDLINHLEPRRNSILCAETNGVMRILASEGSLQHGLSVSAAIADELHTFTTEAQEEVWNALLTALHKRVDSFALVITTAGYDKDTLLGRMYDQALLLGDGEDRFDGCLRIRRDVANGILFWWYGVPEPLHERWQDEKLWAAVNPASWIDLSDLRKQLAIPGFDELDFQRLHLNMWTKSRDAWFPAGVWAGLTDPDAEIPDGGDVFVGVDIGLYHDSTAVVWAHRLKDGRVVLRAKVWTARDDQLGEFVPGGKMRLELVENFILDVLVPRYRIREVAYDPDFFIRSAEILERKGLTMVELLQASGPMASAWQSFYQAVMEQKIAHDGDPILAAHVEAAAADKTERGWKVRKLKSKRIDALAAATMAHARCRLRGSKGPPKVFWMDPFGNDPDRHADGEDEAEDGHEDEDEAEGDIGEDG